MDTGGVFALRNPHTISRLLQEQRPNWAQAQEVGIFGTPLPFTSSTQHIITQPYFMRMRLSTFFGGIIIGWVWPFFA
jgi:hypothetical protein